MAPNHGGETLGSILGPMGSRWGQKKGQKRKKLPCPKIRIFDNTRSSIWEKIEFTVMAPNHGGAPPRVHLGANGVPLGPYNGSKP